MPTPDIKGPLAVVNTPLIIGSWEKALAAHPDRDYVTYLLRGMRNGFRIGYRWGAVARRSNRRNMPSAKENRGVVEDYLQKELEGGRLVGPLDPAKFPGVHVSPFGVRPKSQPGKWRLIVDLSSPAGASVNDGIDPGLCSLSYVKVDDIVEVVLQTGKGSLLAKLDIQSAYRIVPVNPADRLLLGMQWEGRLYIDTALPFGLRSAPKIFNAVADALEWVMGSQGTTYLRHYLDDFITVGASGSNECRDNLKYMLAACEKLGVPVAQHKCEGPVTCLTFLGIEVDTIAQEIRLPREKLHNLRQLLGKWQGNQSFSPAEVESLVGHLSHAATVVRPGRRFLRGMYSLLKAAKQGRWPRVRLNQEFLADLEWWRVFIAPWNGTSMMLRVRARNPDLQLWTDASGNWGCAAVCQDRWF